MSGFDHEHLHDDNPRPIRRRDLLVYILWAACIAVALMLLASALLGGGAP